MAALDVVNMFTTLTSSEQSLKRERKKKEKWGREGRKEKVMLRFTKTNDPIWALSLERVRGQECCKYVFDSLLKVV